MNAETKRNLSGDFEDDGSVGIPQRLYGEIIVPIDGMFTAKTLRQIADALERFDREGK